MKEFKDKKARFFIYCTDKSPVWFLGRIVSMVFRDRAAFVVHTEVSPVVIAKLVHIRRLDCSLKIEEWVEAEEGTTPSQAQ